MLLLLIVFQADGKANPSMILSLLNEEEDRKRKETVISGVGAAAYTGTRRCVVSSRLSLTLAGYCAGGSDTVRYTESHESDAMEIEYVVTDRIGSRQLFPSDAHASRNTTQSASRRRPSCWQRSSSRLFGRASFALRYGACQGSSQVRKLRASITPSYSPFV